MTTDKTYSLGQVLNLATLPERAPFNAFQLAALEFRATNPPPGDIVCRMNHKALTELFVAATAGVEGEVRAGTPAEAATIRQGVRGCIAGVYLIEDNTQSDGHYSFATLAEPTLAERVKAATAVFERAYLADELKLYMEQTAKRLAIQSMITACEIMRDHAERKLSETVKEAAEAQAKHAAAIKASQDAYQVYLMTLRAMTDASVKAQTALDRLKVAIS